MMMLLVARGGRMAAALVMTLASCTPAPSTTVADTEAVHAMRARAEAAENAGDAEALLGLFAEDAVMMPPDRPAVMGVAEARTFVPGFFQAFHLKERFVSQEVVVSGEWAFDRGTYNLTLTSKADSSAVTTEGKYLWLLHRSPEGEWRYARTAWSPNAPSVRP